MNNPKMKIIVVDDHEIVHDGLRLLLRNHPQYEIVQSFTKASLALDFLSKDSIDLLITDISMPEMDGIMLTKTVKKLYPGIRVLVLTVHHDQQSIRDILSAEAEGYILKNTSTKTLVAAIEAVGAGETYYAQETIKAFMSSSIKDQNQSTIATPLSPRELEILQLVVDEYTTQQIAEKLFISSKTVDTHRKNILKKTKVKSIVGLIKFALRHGLVDQNT